MGFSCDQKLGQDRAKRIGVKKKIVIAKGALINTFYFLSMALIPGKYVKLTEIKFSIFTN
jgi:hypothetical protein